MAFVISGSGNHDHRGESQGNRDGHLCFRYTGTQCCFPCKFAFLFVFSFSFLLSYGITDNWLDHIPGAMIRRICLLIFPFLDFFNFVFLVLCILYFYFCIFKFFFDHQIYLCHIFSRVSKLATWSSLSTHQLSYRYHMMRFNDYQISYDEVQSLLSSSLSYDHHHFIRIEKI